MNTLFTVKVRYTKQLDNGAFKRVTEPYVLAADTFSDAEARIYEELGTIIRGEFSVVAITRTELQDIFRYNDADVWYKTITSFESIDEETDKIKTQKMNFLVTANSVKDANEKIKESLNGWLADYTINAVSVTPIVDFFPLKSFYLKEVEEATQRPQPEDYEFKGELLDELP